MSKSVSFMVGVASFVLIGPFVIGERPLEQSRSVELRRVLSAGGSASVPPPEILRESWSTDPTHSVEWDRELNHGTIDLVGAIQRGEWEYVNTLADLQNPAFVSEGRLGCGDRYAGAIETACSYRMEMILQRVDEAKGELVYTRVVPHARHLIDNEPSDPHCHDFVMCLAGVRLGERISIPPGEQQLEFSQELYSPWADPRLFDPSFVKRLAEEYQEHVESYGESPNFATPMDAVEYRFFVNIVPYLRRLADKLGGGEGVT